jgi:hypothetical protein
VGAVSFVTAERVPPVTLCGRDAEARRSRSSAWPLPGLVENPTGLDAPVRPRQIVI